MAFIGNTVQTQGFTPAVDYFSGNGSTVTFTLTRPVAAAVQVEAVIDNVVQNPSTAYTVSGNAITFTSAPLSGTNNIYVRYTSLITTYAAISQSPSVIGDITASGGYLASGSFNNSFLDGTIVDYVTGNGRITVGSADGFTIYTGGTSARSALAAWDSSGNLTNTGTGTFAGNGLVANASTGNGVAVSSNGSTAGAAIIQTQTQTSNQTWRIAVGGGDNAWTAGRSWFLRDDTAGATRLSVDTSGRVTTPSQPFFQAYITGVTFSSTPIYDGVITNIGSAYNSSNGRFTAPIAGVYMISAWYRFNQTGATYCQFGIAKNGSNTGWSGVYINATEANSTYATPRVCAIVSLAAGDYVTPWAAASGGSPSISGSESGYMGYLIG